MADPDSLPDLDVLREAIASGDPARAMPALVGLREVSEEHAIPLLLLGLGQSTFLIRSLACAGLGVKRSDGAWEALVASLQSDDDPNVRAEAANAMASYGPEKAWPLLHAAFVADHHWLVRCSILSALAEQPLMQPGWLLELAELAVVDADGSVRAGGAEILGRLVREGGPGQTASAARSHLAVLQRDSDHRVVATALNALQS